MLQHLSAVLLGVSLATNLVGWGLFSKAQKNVAYWKNESASNSLREADAINAFCDLKEAAHKIGTIVYINGKVASVVPRGKSRRAKKG